MKADRDTTKDIACLILGADTAVAHLRQRILAARAHGQITVRVSTDELTELARQVEKLTGIACDHHEALTTDVWPHR